MSHEAENLGHGFHVGLQGAGALMATAFIAARQNAQAAAADDAARAARLRAASARGVTSSLRGTVEDLRDRLDDAEADVDHLRQQRDQLVKLVAELEREKLVLGRALVAQRAKAA